MSFFLTKGDGEYILTTAGTVALWIILLLFLLAAGAIIVNRQAQKGSNTKRLVFSAMAIALATVTGCFIKLPSLPQGGSITLFSMLFICLIGNWYGLKAGLIAGVAYGIIQLITGPYIYHPLQVLLDYPLAFGALGLSGVFYNQKHGLIKGYVLGVFGRYVCHVISGYIFFTSFTEKGLLGGIMYGLTYNASYIVPELVITLILIAIPPVAKALHIVKREAATI